MSAPTVYAHSLADQPSSAWEPLLEHLEKTAVLARRNASAFGAAEWGELAGWWHDVGKYLPAFQRRLQGSNDHVDHAAPGAALTLSRDRGAVPLAFVIAGHHAGLANLKAQDETRQRPLLARLEEARAVLAELLPLLPEELRAKPVPPLPAFLAAKPTGRSEAEAMQRRGEFWCRFLFSALVDADFLATEAFYDAGRRAVVAGGDPVPVLRARLDSHLAGFRADTEVNHIRARVLRDCRERAEEPPGLFSLTVPTGGGKTLSSMAFALRHAERHGMRRVIVVIPYTSIIEQNARVYRDVLGPHNVLEHHSAVDEPEREREDAEGEVRRKLAAENWDAPVVVTTSVQFFESLFANRPSRCRKLHNVARSVIVLDETQTLPAEFLACAVDALRELAQSYGCSVVLSTATQPALARRESLPWGLEGVREIIREPGELARALRRVEVRWPAGDEPTPYAEVAREVERHERVLAIVHTRKDARTLAEALPERHRYHLSALMCPAHRLKVLDEVRARLKEGKPCRLVATQLVEAGVDIDFPVVFRAMAGLDSLAQAAGRCNREGMLTGPDGEPRRGEFVVFRAETRPPPGILRKGLECAASMANRYGAALDFTGVEHLEEYFRALYALADADQHGVQGQRAQMNFASVADRVRLIEDDYQRPVVVPWGEGARRAEDFRLTPNRATQRALQPYLVQIPEFRLKALLSEGAVEGLHESFHVLIPPFEHLYDEHFGLVIGDAVQANPEALVV